MKRRDLIRYLESHVASYYEKAAGIHGGTIQPRTSGQRSRDIAKLTIISLEKYAATLG
jgi:hypothetical protein